MIDNAVYAFKQSYDRILNGDYFESDLLNKNGKVAGLLDIYVAIQGRVNPDDKFISGYNKIKQRSGKDGYNEKRVLINSLGGYRIMVHLLELFIDALHDLTSFSSRMVLGLLPEDYLIEGIKNLQNSKQKEKVSFWVLNDEDKCTEQIRLINDYLTGMTDSYACQMYKQLTGVKQSDFS